ncbi:hypothetical protein BGX23_003308, partial [Mortierella sp. AD031]
MDEDLQDMLDYLNEELGQTSSGMDILGRLSTPQLAGTIGATSTVAGTQGTTSPLAGTMDWTHALDRIIEATPEISRTNKATPTEVRFQDETPALARTIKANPTVARTIETTFAMGCTIDATCTGEKRFLIWETFVSAWRWFHEIVSLAAAKQEPKDSLHLVRAYPKVQSALLIASITTIAATTPTTINVLTSITIPISIPH